MITPGKILDTILHFQGFDYGTHKTFNPNVDVRSVQRSLNISQSTLDWTQSLDLLIKLDLVKVTGRGVKGDPKMISLTFANRLPKYTGSLSDVPTEETVQYYEESRKRRGTSTNGSI